MPPRLTFDWAVSGQSSLKKKNTERGGATHSFSEITETKKGRQVF